MGMGGGAATGGGHAGRGRVEPPQMVVAMLNAKLVVVMEMVELLECWVR